jgi:ubiquinone/menaquinone biosynthesis C-methylase UbiE
MTHREFFDKAAGNWDQSSIPDESKLKKIVTAADVREGKRVLDVGSGTGVLLPSLRKAAGDAGCIVALDISLNMLRKSRRKFSSGFSYVQADAETPSFRESVFDTIVCFSVFPHFRFKQQALSAMSRALRTGGKLLIAHAASREAMNDFHRRVGGVVENDAIPEEEEMMKLLREASFVDPVITNETDLYLALGTKP